MQVIRLRFGNLGRQIILGHERERGALRIEIDCSEVLSAFPGAFAAITVEPPGGDKAACYPAVTRMDGGTLVWDVQPCDMAVRGKGRFQVDIFGANGELLKSEIASMRTCESLGGVDVSPPDGVKAWQEDAARTLDAVRTAGKDVAWAIERTDEAANHAQNMADEAQSAAKAAQDIARTLNEKLESGAFVGPQGERGSPGTGIVDVRIVNAQSETPDGRSADAEDGTV